MNKTLNRSKVLHFMNTQLYFFLYYYYHSILNFPQEIEPSNINQIESKVWVFVDKTHAPPVVFESEVLERMKSNEPGKFKCEKQNFF